MADSENKVLVCLGKHKRAVSFTTPDGYKSPPNPHPNPGGVGWGVGGGGGFVLIGA